jgi:hypothetical protein
LVRPHWKKYVVDRPFGFTVPWSTALVEFTELVVPVMTDGDDAAAATPAKAPAATTAAASTFSLGIKIPTSSDVLLPLYPL